MVSTISVGVVLGVIAFIEINDVHGRLSEEYLKKLNELVNAEENPVVYLAIDPGKANGICGYGEKYDLLFMLTIHANDMVMFLHQFKKVKKCIMESYNLYPKKAQQQLYSDMETSRVIGRVEYWTEHAGVELVMQPASIKSTGYKWIGQKPLPKSNPKNHALDGHVHFMYWAIKHGLVSAADILKLGR